MASLEDKSKQVDFPSLTEWKEKQVERWNKYGRQVHANSTSMFAGFIVTEGNPTIGDIIEYGVEKGLYKACRAVIAGFEHGAQRFRSIRSRIAQRRESRPQ